MVGLTDKGWFSRLGQEDTVTTVGESMLNKQLDVLPLQGIRQGLLAVLAYDVFSNGSTPLQLTITIGLIAAEVVALVRET